MNTSTNTNQTYDTMKITMRTTPTGFGRHTMAGALLAMALTASAVGFAAMGHADDDTQIPGTDPAPAAPPPAAASPWLDGLIDRAFRPHLHCGNRGFENSFRCDWY
jgi:hypothetical protein